MANAQSPPPASPADKAASPMPAASAGAPDPVNLDSESVAGEEDPGASIDMPVAPATKSAQTGQPPIQQVPMPSSEIHPGDEAPEGTSGTAETICRECGGSGRAANGPCSSCDGSGKVTVGLGGA